MTLFSHVLVVIACMCVVAEILASVQQLLHVQNSDQEALEQNLTS